MKESVKTETGVSPDIDQVKEDILALTRDLATLIDKMKTVAADGSADAIRESVEQLSEKTRGLYDKVGAQGRRSAEAVGRQVEAQPVLSLLVAFAVGFVASRLLSR